MLQNTYRLEILVKLTMQFAAAAVLLTCCQTTWAQGNGYVYAYFQGGWPTGGSSGVYLSYSSDGFDFSPLNDGQPVFDAPQPPGFPTGENQTRDPSITYGPDGQFHMVWTSGITTKTIGYASSPDLVNWSTPKRIEIWDENVNVDNTWAPEIYYDESEEEYFVMWASDINNGHHRLYSFTTTDFETISTPQVFYDNGNTVIDGAIAHDVANNQYVMAIKDEVNGAKNIWLSTSATAQGAYTLGNAPIVGPGSATDGNAVEGPSLIKIGDQWHLYYDAYGAGYLGLITSPDLTTWTNRNADSNLPSGHHGTVFAASNAAIGWELPFMRSDLNNDGDINSADWLLFRSNHLGNLSGYSPSEQASRGDLNGDGFNDYDDFNLFKKDYHSFNPAVSFQEMVASIPEPTCCSLLIVGGGALLAPRRN